MKVIFVFFMLIYLSTSDENLDSCTITDVTMNCSNKNMSDCPTVNVSITHLNMENNKLRNLTVGNCANWTHLRVFRISNNSIEQLVDLHSFNNLNEINASHNFLKEILIVGDALTLVDLSYNNINTVEIGSVAFLKSLILSHNNLTEDSCGKILQGNTLPSINTLDFSYNKILGVPIDFMSFQRPYLSFINLAGNNITEVSFVLFNGLPKHIKINFSYNLISTLKFSGHPSINKIDLSHNLLTLLDNISMSQLQTMKTIDLSYNPFNCSCSFIPPFVDWMKKNRDKFINKNVTNCRVSPVLNIFNGTCHPVVSPSSHLWIIPVVLISFVIPIISVVGYRVYRRRRSGYTEIGEPNSPSICFPSTWLNMNCLHSRVVNVDPSTNSERLFTDPQVLIIGYGVFRWRRSEYIELKDSRSNCLSYSWRDLESLNQSNLTIDIPAEPENVSSYQQAKLIVLCSSANMKWAVREITAHLKIETQIIDSKVLDLPSSNFILVIVHGDSDLYDSKLIKHVTFVLAKRNSVNIRLLLRSIPSQKALENSSGLSQFINEEIMNKSHIMFDAEYPLTSIDRLKEWLHITDYPYSV